MALHTGENSPPVVYAQDAGRLLVTPGQHPVVPSELTAVVRDAGERFGLVLTVEYLPSAWGQSCFVVKQKWPQGDKKWERVQCGELPERDAFDVTFRFPPEMRTGDMVAMVRDKFGFVHDPKREALRMMEEAQRRLAALEDKQVDQVVDASLQRHADETPHLREVRAGAAEAHPMVSGIEFTGPKRLIAKDG